MVTRHRSSKFQRRGALMTELLVAMAILVTALMPIAYSIASERRLAKGYYQRAVAMEIVDGEMEILLAGEWRSFSQGQQEYHIKAGAVTNLPPGHFLLTLQESKIRLDWFPDERQNGGPITRTAVIK